MKAWTDEECDRLRESIFARHPDRIIVADPIVNSIYENALIRAAVDEARREAANIVMEWPLLPVDKQFNLLEVRRMLVAAILARDKEPRDAER